MTLSLWQHGTCVKSVLVNEMIIHFEALHLRPEFSGETKDSNNDHKIQWWIDMWGTEKDEVVAHQGGKRLLLEEGDAAVTEGLEAVPPAEKLLYFYRTTPTQSTTRWSSFFDFLNWMLLPF